jgi:uncharacterized protein YjbJ (UPF0337 family)
VLVATGNGRSLGVKCGASTVELLEMVGTLHHSSHDGSARVPPAGGVEWPDIGGVMNSDELEGKVKAVKGKVKQATGDLTDDPNLQDEGVADEAEGNAQETWGRAKRKVGETIEDIGDAVKK